MVSNLFRSSVVTAFPGWRFFQPLVAYVQGMLIAHGTGRFHLAGHLFGWLRYSREACAAFQCPQDWCGEQAVPDAAASPYPVNGYGQDLLTASASADMAEGKLHHPSALLPTHSPIVEEFPSGAPEFPGPQYFGPGQANIWILLLRLRLIAHGWIEEDQITDLQADPGLWHARVWDEDLRYACTRAQLARGCRGTAADGYPTEDTWNQLWAP
ncbi:hypothetical protein [Streptomyces yunnanensis]|nr:hypothetical protein [Streptomyces yunnanensis]